jgi:hypothetical protein
MMDPYVAFFDIETAEKIDDMPGRFRDDKIKQLTISCASVMMTPLSLCLDPANRERAIEMSTMRTFWVDGEGGTSLDAMCAILSASELIIGYNLAGFDWMVAEKYFRVGDDFRRCREKTHDVFSRVRDATGVWHKLDTLLMLNAIERKTADGLIAIRWWKEGNRTDLQTYCEGGKHFCNSSLPLHCCSYFFRFVLRRRATDGEAVSTANTVAGRRARAAEPRFRRGECAGVAHGGAGFRGARRRARPVAQGVRRRVS